MHMAHRHDNPAHDGIRTARWKLIVYYGLPLDAAGAVAELSPAGWELYDLQNDPCELCNLYGQAEYAQVTADLKHRLGQVKEELGDTDERYPELMARRRNTA
jgi:N-acetylglucosamine-6-sulfatase